MTLIIQDHFADPILDDLSNREIDIDNRGNSSELMDYQVIIDTSKHVDKQGMRFVDENLKIIDYWKEDTNITWMEIPKIVGSKVSAVQMIYGDIDNKSDGDTTFEFFDDFVDESVVYEVWSAVLDEGDTYSANHAILKNEKIYATTGKGGTSTDNYLYIFDANTGSKITKIPLNKKGGITSPQISGNYIFVFECADNGSGAFEKIDLTTNTVIWTQTFSGTFAECFAIDTTYAYLPLNGKISKRKLSDGSEVDTYTVTTLNYLYGSGTVLVDGTIYYRSQDGYLKSINPADMTLNWQVALDRQSSTSYNSPIYLSDKDYVVVADCTDDRSAGTIYAIDISTQSEIWHQSFTNGSFPSILSYENGKIFAGKFNSSGGKYIALNADNGSILWQADSIDSAWHVPTPIGGYITNYKEGILSLINTTNGDIMWTKNYSFTGVCGIGIAYNGMHIACGYGGLKAFRIGASGAKNDWLHKNYDIYQTGYSPNAITDIYLTITKYNVEDKWNITGSGYEIENNTLKITGGSWGIKLFSKYSLDYEKSIITKSKFGSSAGNWNGVYRLESSQNAWDGEMIGAANGDIYDFEESTNHNAGISIDTSKWYRLEACYSDLFDYYIFKYDSTIVYEDNTFNPMLANINDIVITTYNQPFYTDYILVRKYTSPEPIVVIA